MRSSSAKCFATSNWGSVHFSKLLQRNALFPDCDVLWIRTRQRGSRIDIQGGSSRLCRWRIESQESGSCVARTPLNLVRVRRIGDKQKQANHQVAPKQRGELLGHFRRVTVEETGRPRPDQHLLS